MKTYIIIHLGGSWVEAESYKWRKLNSKSHLEPFILNKHFQLGRPAFTGFFFNLMAATVNGLTFFFPYWHLHALFFILFVMQWRWCTTSTFKKLLRRELSPCVSDISLVDADWGGPYLSILILCWDFIFEAWSWVCYCYVSANSLWCAWVARAKSVCF